jgi:hypothetical protein
MISVNDESWARDASTSRVSGIYFIFYFFFFTDDLLLLDYMYGTATTLTNPQVIATGPMITETATL